MSQPFGELLDKKTGEVTLEGAQVLLSLRVSSIQLSAASTGRSRTSFEDEKIKLTYVRQSRADERERLVVYIKPYEDKVVLVLNVLFHEPLGNQLFPNEVTCVTFRPGLWMMYLMQQAARCQLDNYAMIDDRETFAEIVSMKIFNETMNELASRHRSDTGTE